MGWPFGFQLACCETAQALLCTCKVLSDSLHFACCFLNIFLFFLHSNCVPLPTPAFSPLCACHLLPLPPPRWRRGAAAPPRGRCPPWAGLSPGRRGGCCRRRLSPCDESISPHCHVSRAAAQGRAGLPSPCRPPPFPPVPGGLRPPAPAPPRGSGQRRPPGGSARRQEERSAGNPLRRPVPPGGPGQRCPRGGSPLPADVRAARGCVSTAPAVPCREGARLPPSAGLRAAVGVPSRSSENVRYRVPSFAF